MNKLLALLSLFTISGFSLVFAQTAEEKKVLDEINFARTQPKIYAQEVLEPLIDGTESEYQSAVTESINFLNKLSPVSELFWSSGLYESAAEESAGVEKYGYDSTDPNYSARISKYTSWKSCGEMDVFGYSDARGIVVSSILDILSQDNAHRDMIFSKKFTHFGSAIGNHKTFGGHCVMDFASDCISYNDLPGALYKDISAEQVVSEINLARTNPAEYIATRLLPIKPDSGKFADDIQSLISYLEKMESVQALVYNSSLCSAAERFVSRARPVAGTPLPQSDQWKNNICKTRSWGIVSEAFIVGESDPRAAVIRMLLDGKSNNRKNLLWGELNFAGACVGINSVVCVDLASWHDETNIPEDTLINPDSTSKIIAELNLARTNPKEYSATRLAPLVKKDSSQFQKALSELMRELSSMKPLPALTVVDDLNKAASQWTDYLNKNSVAAYDADWLERISQFGRLDGGSEVLYFGESTPEQTVINLLVNEKNSSRKSRKALLSKSYTCVGVSASVHGVYSGVALIELASNFIPANELVLPSKASSYGKTVTVSEVDVLKEINLARAKPKEYVKTRLTPLVTSEKNAYQTALAELISELNKMGPVSELKFSTQLHDAAAEYVESAVDKTKLDSESQWLARIEKFVPNWKKAGEVISGGCYTAKDIALQLLIDNGVAKRGHRRILLNGDLNQAGVAIGENSKFGIMCCIDLAKVTK